MMEWQASSFHGDADPPSNISQIHIGGESDDDDDHHQPNYAVFSCSLVLVLVIVIGNSLTIFIFSTSPKLFNQTALCLINLAIADFMTGIAFTSFGLPCSLHGGDCIIRSSHSACLTIVIISYSCAGVSGTTLIIVSIDRCLKISRPLRYHTICTKLRTVCILLVSWVLVFTITTSFMLGSPHIIQYNFDYYHCGLQQTHPDAIAYSYIIDIVFFVCPVSVMTVCSLKVAMISRKARCQIANQEAVCDPRNSRRGTPPRRPGSTDMRVTVRIFIVVFAFVMCYLPYCAELAYARWTSKTFPSRLSLAALTMVQINSAINPIIYVTTYGRFRRALFWKLRRLCGRPSRASSVVWTVTSVPPRDRSRNRQGLGVRTSPLTHSNRRGSLCSPT